MKRTAICKEIEINIGSFLEKLMIHYKDDIKVRKIIQRRNEYV